MDGENGYKEGSVWRVALVYLIVAALIYGAIYYFVLAKKPATSLKTSPRITEIISDWPTANQNFSNTRAAVGSGINSSTVAKLAPSWLLPIVGISEWGAATTNPIVVGNIVYFQDLESNIYAVDFTTGKQLWMKITGPNGVAIENGKIFAQKGHYDIVALDLNGNEVWDKKLSDNLNIGVDVQLIAYQNVVYASTVPGITNINFYKGGSIGVIYALDAATGATKWSFDTIDTTDIWGNAKVNSGGGAWYPPAIDPRTNMMFWGIGNPAPWPGTPEFPNGSSRPGPNLYTSSMVALNMMDGKLTWYNQVSPHDLFDYDFEVSPILATVDGKEIVIGAGKMGKVVAFDRKNGKTIWSTPVGDHLNDNLTKLPPGITKVSPSPLGGVETNLAYSDGIVFAPLNNMTVNYTPTEFVASTFNLALGKGELVALNATTGKILWSNKFNSLDVGAATVVNDLVFTATYDGMIYAFEVKTGKELWTYKAPGGINGWPAVKADTIIFPVGLGKTPQLLAFKIGGTLKTSVAPTLPPAQPGKGFQQ
jgi:glucose dehydrogenase